MVKRKDKENFGEPDLFVDEPIVSEEPEEVKEMVVEVKVEVPPVRTVALLNKLNYSVHVKYRGKVYQMSPHTYMRNLDERFIDKPLPSGVSIITRN